MEGIDIYKSQKEEYCACCRKQGKDYTDVIVGIFRMPFCEECFGKFKEMIAKGATKEVVGV